MLWIKLGCHFSLMAFVTARYRSNAIITNVKLFATIVRLCMNGMRQHIVEPSTYTHTRKMEENIYCKLCARYLVVDRDVGFYLTQLSDAMYQCFIVKRRNVPDGGMVTQFNIINQYTCKLGLIFHALNIHTSQKKRKFVFYFFLIQFRINKQKKT